VYSASFGSKCCFSGFDSLMRVTAKACPLQCSRTFPCNKLVRCLLFLTLQLSRCSSHTETRGVTPCCGPDFWHARIDYHN
jgi:hypothetical protein